MTDRRQANGLHDLKRLRGAQVQLAAAAARQAHQVQHDAQLAQQHQALRRDDAAQTWLRLQRDATGQAGLTRLGAAWLVEQEQQLGAAQSHLAIAESQSSIAQLNHAKALQSEAVASSINAKFAATLAGKQAERQSTELADLWARRCSQCL